MINKLPKSTNFLPRHLYMQLKQRYQASRSVYIFGPRQSGKTTLACQTFPELPYATLEDPDKLEYASSDPRGFFNSMPNGGIIDEPQKIPALFSYLQSQIDFEHKKFILTSSQNFLTMESISQSLAGRITILNLYPFSQREIKQIKPENLFENNNQLIPIEIKAGQTVNNKMLSGLQKWCELANIDSGVLIYGGS